MFIYFYAAKQEIPSSVPINQVAVTPHWLALALLACLAIGIALSQDSVCSFIVTHIEVVIPATCGLIVVAVALQKISKSNVFKRIFYRLDPFLEHVPAEVLLSQTEISTTLKSAAFPNYPQKMNLDLVDDVDNFNSQLEESSSEALD